MNTVPFDKLGPGQSGRLAYQVLDQDGPISNPQNICYLPPNSLEIPSTSPPQRPTPVAVGAPIGGADAVALVVVAGLGLVGYWLYRKFNEEDVEKADTVAPSVSERIDSLEEDIAGLRESVSNLNSHLEQPGSMFYLSTEYQVSELDDHFGRFKDPKDIDKFICGEERVKVLEKAKLCKVLLSA